MSTPGKDTVYIDIDDEITGIIDKVLSSEHRIVALVLPKRATVFQSIVNMKLLKRSAEAAKKHIVLITSEAGLLPLAGAVGLHVAKTLNSRPEIPDAAETVQNPDAAEEIVMLDNSAEGVTVETAGDRPIGELADSVAGSALVVNDSTESDEPAAGAAAAKPAKVKKDKKLKIPNFNKFRLRLVLGVLGLILLIIGWYVAFTVMPKAEIAIKTDSSEVNSSLDITLDSGADKLDLEQRLVPAKLERQQKTLSQQVPATGQRDDGTKASGTVTMSIPCGFNLPEAVPAGIGVSAAGLTFITQQRVDFDTDFSSGNCYFVGSTPVVAQQNGDKYNLKAQSYQVASSNAYTPPDSLSTEGSDMTGGTSKMVKVVSRSDIDAAQKKLDAEDNDQIKKDLAQSLKQDGLYAITDTFSGADPVITTSSSIGDTADTVTVTRVVTYRMYGASEDDLKKLIISDVKQQIDTSKQSILDDGLSEAVFNVLDNGAKTAQVRMQVTAFAGPDIRADELKQQVAGLKSGEVKSMLKQHVGVTDVDVHLSPFWVNSIPDSLDKITVTFDKTPSNHARSDDQSR